MPATWANGIIKFHAKDLLAPLAGTATIVLHNVVVRQQVDFVVHAGAII
jgi:hypothetical protein